MISAEFYLDRASWLHRADPRVKFLLMLTAIPLTLITRNVFLMLGAILLAGFILRSAQIPLETILRPIKALLPISAIMVIVWVVFYPVGESVQVGPARIAPLSLISGLTVALRINAVTLFVFAWLYTTPHESSVRALVKLRIPYVWGLTFLLAMRYIPSFQRSYTMILDAQRARALSYEAARGFRRVKLLMPVLVALVISSFRSSEQLSVALEARGLGGNFGRRTFLHDLRFSAHDAAYALVIMIAAAGVLFLHIALGIGTETIRLIR